ncbi:hypothetical protein FRB90_011114 [Tulasnella sp. 427]|nr:hypothetical protein FRB90_011114 [Tulasnella sp. 427]
MKVVVKDWHAVAHWRWATGKDKDKEVTATGGAEDEEDEDDLCGICRFMANVHISSICTVFSSGSNLLPPKDFVLWIADLGVSLSGMVKSGRSY